MAYLHALAGREGRSSLVSIVPRHALFSGSYGVAPPLLHAALALKRGLCLGGCWVGRLAHLSASADAAPFPHETPLPEKVRLHVEPVEPAHAPGRINAMEGNGAHALSLEIVAMLTL
jgi:hypothetical protein